jgi:hypothetical protein
VLTLAAIVSSCGLAPFYSELGRSKNVLLTIIRSAHVRRTIQPRRAGLVATEPREVIDLGGMVR